MLTGLIFFNTNKSFEVQRNITFEWRTKKTDLRIGYSSQIGFRLAEIGIGIKLFCSMLKSHFYFF